MGKKFTFIDLFAGAGGLSEGFLSENFEAIAHIEMNKDACKTLQTRTAYYYLKNSGKLDIYQNYLKGKFSQEDLLKYVPKELIERVINREMDESNLEDIFAKVDSILSSISEKEIDLIVGGPPCQAYSLIGRAVKSDGMEGDRRNYLYRLYGNFLEKFNPKLFVFENVPGLLSANKGIYFLNMQDYFKSIGYKIDFRILNASDFGVLQNRKRVILIGWKDNLDIKYPEFDLCKKSFTVNSLFEDLPSLLPGETKSKYLKPKNNYLSDFEIRSEDDILTLHLARPHNQNDISIYKYAISLWNKNQSRLSYDLLPEHLATHKNKKVFLDRFKVVAGNLNASQTLMAHIAKDGHYFIHPDIEQARSISIREAARIQSFPDNFYFEGSRTSIFTQIGNAVPPLMGKKIACKIKELLNRGINEK